MNAYWASMIIMWVVTVSAAMVCARDSKRLRAATNNMVTMAAQAGIDAPLADWARHVVLTVTTRTGRIYAKTLDELRQEPTGGDRTWADPMLVSIRRWGPEALHQLHEETDETTRG